MTLRLPGKALFAPSTPNPQPVRDVPTTDSADAERRRKETISRARLRKGFGTSRLTNPLGDTSAAPVQRRTLGGE